MCKPLPESCIQDSFKRGLLPLSSWSSLFLKAVMCFKEFYYKGIMDIFLLRKIKPGGSYNTILETLNMCSTALYVEQPESMVWLLSVSILPVLSHFRFLGKTIYISIMYWINQTFWEKKWLFSFTCNIYVVVAGAVACLFSGFMWSVSWNNSSFFLSEETGSETSSFETISRTHFQGICLKFSVL